MGLKGGLEGLAGEDESVTPMPERYNQPANLRRLLTWYLAIRLVMVSFFLGGSVVYHLQQNVWHQAPVARFLTYLVLLTLMQSWLSAVLLARLRNLRHFVNAHLSWDLLFVILVIYLTGGVESLFSFFYILVIISASVFCPRPQLLVVASAASILYGSLLDLQYYGYLPFFKGQAFPRSLNHYDVFYAVFLHVGAFLLTALLSGALAERLRRSEAAREKREIDYGELERLNQAILANISSGLMVVNTAGRIRSFNGGASKITGYRLEQVYNRPIEAIFPEFKRLEPSSNYAVERGEMLYHISEGELLTLGYSVGRVLDRDANDLGMLIAFQDLTDYKALEEQLKRADRQAAVGRLASGLAHEIRNPLASISGSVQLLLEGRDISLEDRRLMKIVIKEADRLSHLLSDFLNFARPAPVQMEPVNLATLIDELIALSRGSGKFHDQEIITAYPRPVYMTVDLQKMHQILWDLLLNASDAAGPGGTIRISVESALGEIVVEDSGPGVAAEDRARLFEPFFTTKDRGTGLGLANVYANVEAHGGTIRIETGSLGGARFTIELPGQCRMRQSDD